MKKLETLLAQIGNRSETVTGTVNPPVYFSTAYRHAGIGESTGFDYIRTGNPTRKIVEEAIARLEGGDQGYAFSSGMAAIQTVLALFESGDEFLVSADLYGGTYRLFERGWRKYGLGFHYVDFADLDAVEEKITERTKAIFLETPTNPLMHETDIRAVSELARRYGLLLIVDNTFYTPVLQRPIEQGADIVIHSATKYLGGHNDVLAGLVVAKGEELCQRLAEYHNAIGAVLSPFDSWLLIRGMKTLALRMRQHEENAKRICSFLREHEEVTDVLYPGRGGMLSFRIADEKWVNGFLRCLRLITFAESLGGVESFITYPATQTHADIPEEIRIQNGVCNRLLRFSVGIEHADDLIADLAQALKNMKEV
ncbi:MULTISPECIES: methionine biosynthesis PLP-dependent protein [Geobacillus]|mgnify:CR=1 FL=1|jgi:cystathionine gamma-synthase|uniref:Cystathionine gamma-synthase, O-succinylhomoserine(Thiol)-lyase n=1 Tax=Geobacillus thermodenitrificans (strain NG80-2) TaxID=420246 RepID=A4ILC1_GEOTN|nr:MULTISPECIES: methionine biosynthesis PLP-dependent protein [Geobacillus]ABO66125.1 Cystathionine gamma-synthase, O-succinylhomoserine(thiol)-lyase [Geobacillus thermodenitrificans NG80-2]ARA97441.1 cystathionine gamma-synthase [Geobacillus thermodenitrificans]ARP41856.1 Cystathionine gamma-synthase [Geobacillus thermodenitrificans]ATO36767.1 cystathionine gamma-synthase [Geobacillus thermodenitrificans]KQB94455.1 Cystathionine gamma-synthase/O-acetylhomoserine (thiol)-lyase [Geobacillus sp